MVDALEVHVVESIVGIESALQCGVRSDETDILGGEECRETVVANLDNGDKVAVSQGRENV